MSGNFNASFFKLTNQMIKKIQLFFANGKMVENTIDDTLLSTSPEATPIPPNPTPVKTPELPTNYPHTYIPAEFQVTTVAGSNTNGYLDSSTGTSAKFNYPQGIAVDSNGNLFVADSSNHRIRKITTSGSVTTVAGSPNTDGYLDGTASQAKFSWANGIAIDNNSNTIYVADTGNNRIRKIN